MAVAAAFAVAAERAGAITAAWVSEEFPPNEEDDDEDRRNEDQKDLLPEWNHGSVLRGRMTLRLAGWCVGHGRCMADAIKRVKEGNRRRYHSDRVSRWWQSHHFRPVRGIDREGFGL